MSAQDRISHWNAAYESKGEAGVSWFEALPQISLGLIEEVMTAQGRTAAETALIDIGGGASRLVDGLLAAGMRDITVLDLAPAALAAAKERLGDAARTVTWLTADVTHWQPAAQGMPRYDIWHDRAAFHFLTEAADRAAYVSAMRLVLKPGGHAIMATFATDGPERCSGLPVMRYDAERLAATIGDGFRLVRECQHIHHTPWNSSQAFQFTVLQRLSA